MIINKRKHKILNHPIIGILLLTILSELFVQSSGIVIGAPIYGLGLNSNPIIVECAASIGMIIYSLAFLWIYKLWFQGDYKGSISLLNFGLGMLYFAIPLLFICGSNILSISELGNPFYAFLIGVAPGINEEIVFRAIPLSNAMRNIKNGYMIYIYVLISALIFGLLHIINLVAGAGWGATLSQVIYATGIGIMLGAVFVRTGNILPCIVAHSLIDITAMLDNSLQEASGVLSGNSFDFSLLIASFIIFLIPCLAACFIIRKSKHEEIINIWNNRWNKK